jgi:hypothetical protein
VLARGQGLLPVVAVTAVVALLEDLKAAAGHHLQSLPPSWCTLLFSYLSCYSSSTCGRCLGCEWTTSAGLAGAWGIPAFYLEELVLLVLVLLVLQLVLKRGHTQLSTGLQERGR